MPCSESCRADARRSTEISWQRNARQPVIAPRAARNVAAIQARCVRRQAWGIRADPRVLERGRKRAYSVYRHRAAATPLVRRFSAAADALLAASADRPAQAAFACGLASA